MKRNQIAEILREHFKKLGSKGGKVKSDAKREASRRNGRKGGRPRKVKKETK